MPPHCPTVATSGGSARAARTPAPSWVASLWLGVSLFAVVGWPLLWTPSAHATTVLRVTVDDLRDEADLIVRARVHSSRAVALSDAPGHLRTHVDLEVLEVWKDPRRLAAADGTLHLDLLGGTRNGATLRVPGMPAFTAGDEVVLCLEKTPRNWAFMGMGQGVFRIRRTFSAKDATTVHRRLGPVHVVNRTPEGRIEAAEPAPHPTTLDGLRRALQRPSP